jgi:hypothetical protein
MANGSFLIGNIAAAAAPACANANADYPAIHLVDGIPGLTYRSAAGTASPRWDFGSAQTIGAVALINHNIPDDAAIKLQFSSNAWAAVAEEIELTWAAGNIYKILSAPKSYRYMGFSVVLSSGSYVEIGEAFLGNNSPLTKNFGDRYTDIFKVHKTTLEIDGQWFQDIRGKSRGFSLPFGLLTAAERAIIESLLEEEYVIFIPDTAAAVCYHGAIPQDKLQAALRRGLAGGSIEFWMNTAGGL